MSINVASLFKNWALSKGLSTEYFAEVDSTNNRAKKEAISITENLKLYITDHQTAGRGRNQNSWVSPEKGSSIMVSFSFLLDKPPQAVTAPLFGLALYQACKTSFPHIDLSLKAPNDLYLQGKKVAGLLIEAIQMGQQIRLIVGLGLNAMAAPGQGLPAIALSEATEINADHLHQLFENLLIHFGRASVACEAAQLSETERKDLLNALNQNSQLSEKYAAISPFGDLVTAKHRISWKDL